MLKPPTTEKCAYRPGAGNSTDWEQRWLRFGAGPYYMESMSKRSLDPASPMSINRCPGFMAYAAKHAGTALAQRAPTGPPHVTGDEMVCGDEQGGCLTARSMFLPFSMYEYDSSYAVGVQKGPSLTSSRAG